MSGLLIGGLMGILGVLAYRQIKAQENGFTYTAIERAFLDEIREKGVWDEGELSSDQSICVGEHSIISQYDFYTNLKKLVNERSKK